VSQFQHRVSFLKKIRALVGDIDVDLDAQLPPEEISEEEYRAALVEGEQLMALPVTQVNRLRMERVCDLIEAFESQFTDFNAHQSDTTSD
jgi:hypothetical protein